MSSGHPQSINRPCIWRGSVPVGETVKNSPRQWALDLSRTGPPPRGGGGAPRAESCASAQGGKPRAGRQRRDGGRAGLWGSRARTNPTGVAAQPSVTAAWRWEDCLAGPLLLQQITTSLSSGGQKFRTGFTGQKSRCQPTCIPFWKFKGRIHSPAFSSF